MIKTLYVGHLSTIYHTAFILMEDKTLGKNFNRTLEWILFGTGPAMVKAFENGQLDAGYMGLPPAIIGIDRGAPIKCVAGGHIEGTVMIAREEFKGTTELNDNLGDIFAQFIGKTIGVPSKGSIHEVILAHYLKKYDLTQDIHIKYYSQPEFIAIDMKKRILDAGVGTPALAIFAKTILRSHIIIPAGKLWAYNPSYGIFFHKSFILNHPDFIIEFLKHHKNASTLLRSSEPIAIEKISKSFGVLTNSYVESVLKVSPKYCIALSEDYVKSTMRFVRKLHELGYVSKILDVNDIFEYKFVEQVHPEKNHYDNIKDTN